MIGGDHLQERFSERIQNRADLPKQRGFTNLINSGDNKRGYSVRTLTGNWAEERRDSGYYDQRPLLGTELERVWKTTYGDLAKVPGVAKAGPPPPEKVIAAASGTLSQQRLVDVQAGRHRCYPGHQPEFDPTPAAAAAGGDRGATVLGETEVRASYRNPRDVRLPEPEFVPSKSGSAGDTQCQAVVHRVRTRLLARPGATFTGLRRSLRSVDTSQSGSINSKELQEGLARCGVSLVDAEIAVLMHHFDRDYTGVASLHDFVAGVRGDMNERRLALVKKGFRVLEGVCDGAVKLSDILRLYDVAWHPDVRSGATTAAAERRSFAELWDVSGDAIVSLDDFVEYYNDVSALVNADHHFEQTMRNCWHLSGGEGICANQSCRRVRIVHTTGRVTVEDIKNDLGVEAHDLVRMRANLVGQGIIDIARIEVL